MPGIEAGIDVLSVLGREGGTRSGEFAVMSFVAPLCGLESSAFCAWRGLLVLIVAVLLSFLSFGLEYEVGLAKENLGVWRFFFLCLEEVCKLLLNLFSDI